MSERPSPTVPRLLVSVRSVAEAQAALAGGCDVLDVKEPAHGALGMADPDVIGEIIAAVRPGPTSAALGEARDWPGSRSAPMLPAGLDFAKLGLAGLGRSSDWTRSWLAVRSRFDAACARPLRWIAVVYADWQAAGAPCPESVIEAAAETTCAGVLFDTWLKDGRTLLDTLPDRSLAALTRRVHDAGLLLALGGRLTADLLPSLAPLAPDIVAIRTAACRDGQRDGPVTSEAVGAFRQIMR